MPPTTETTKVTKTTRQQEGRAIVRTANSETTQRRGGTVVKRVDGETKTKTETPESEKAKLSRLARVAASRSKPPEPRPLTKTFFQTVLRTLEAERRSLPADPTQYNLKAAMLYEEIRSAINKAAKAIEDPEWKRALHNLIEGSKRGRAALAAMQLHGPARQNRQTHYWEETLEQGFALLQRAAA